MRGDHCGRVRVWKGGGGSGRNGYVSSEGLREKSEGGIRLKEGMAHVIFGLDIDSFLAWKGVLHSITTFLQEIQRNFIFIHLIHSNSSYSSTNRHHESTDLLRALPSFQVRAQTTLVFPDLTEPFSIGMALTDALDDLISDFRISPQLAMKILANFDKSIAEVLNEKVKATLQFKVRLLVYTHTRTIHGNVV